MGEPRSTQSSEDAIDALADVQRRNLLLALREDDTLHDWRDVVADSEEGPQTDARIVEMHHVHLPKLADQGYIDWDPRSNTIVKGWNYEELEPLLGMLADTDDSELLQNSM